jgi:hypothetical protein
VSSPVVISALLQAADVSMREAVARAIVKIFEDNGMALQLVQAIFTEIQQSSIRSMLHGL